MLLRALVVVLFVAFWAPVGVAAADDDVPPPAGPPPASFAMTSGAPIREGAVYGVGTVIVAHFASPVGNRAEAEQSVAVQANPPVAGSWHWVNNQTAHWRPPQYWEPGTVVSIASGPTFTIGASHIAIADDNTKQVTVFDGGKLVRTMPTSMGRGGSETINGKTLTFWTQPGTYTVLDKSNPVIMDSSTYGLPINSHLGYKETIPYAVRISTDGIYLHELDATVSAQGNTNTSHGCLNLNGENAKWYYNFSVPGDVVEVRHTGGKPLQLWQNGDWSVPWDQW